MQVLIRNGKINGVLLENGTEVHCPWVISNADPIHTCMVLVGAENLPRNYIKELGTYTASAEIMSVYLGLDAPPSELGMTEHSVFFSAVDPKSGPPAMNGGNGPLLFPGADLANYTATDPNYGPKGTTTAAINTGCNTDWWTKLSPADYFAGKDTVAEKLLDMTERTLSSDIRKHIEVIEIGSPITNMRYTGNLGGSFQGFVQTRLASGQKRLKNQSPMKGLYFSGAWINGGSYPYSMFTARDTVDQLLSDMNQGQDGTIMSYSGQDVQMETDDKDISTLRCNMQRDVVQKIHPVGFI